jgi:hypothetical protein
MADLNIGDSVMKFYDWGSTIPNKPNSLKVYDGSRYWCTEKRSLFVAVALDSNHAAYSENGINWT